MKNTLAPFDLEKALAGEPVITRDGREVTEIFMFKTFKNADPLTAIIDGDRYCFTEMGQWHGPHYESKHDLFMASKPVFSFGNVYHNRVGLCFDTIDEVSKHTGAISICKFSILNGRVVSAETVHEY